MLILYSIYNMNVIFFYCRRFCFFWRGDSRSGKYSMGIGVVYIGVVF